MTIFAVSDVVWQALIAAVLAVVVLWMQQRNAMKVAEKVKAVATTLETTTDVTTKKLDVVGEDVLRIEKATNSMKDALVKAAGDAGELKGIKDEQLRVAGEKEGKS